MGEGFSHGIDADAAAGRAVPAAEIKPSRLVAGNLSPQDQLSRRIQGWLRVSKRTRMVEKEREFPLLGERRILRKG